MDNLGLIRWNRILTHPRQTINWVLERNPGQLTLLAFIFFAGIFKEIEKSLTTNYGNSADLIELLFTILHGGLLKLVTYTILIWGVSICSSLFGGKGNFKKTQIALTWPLFLVVTCGFLLNIISYSVYDSAIFSTDISYFLKRDFLITFNWGFSILYFAFIAWYLSLIVISISEAQQFSIFKSISSIVCGFLVAVVPLFIITFAANPRFWLWI
jgi:Yip1 domain